jgi:hypothetical protein
MRTRSRGFPTTPRWRQPSSSSDLARASVSFLPS